MSPIIYENILYTCKFFQNIVTTKMSKIWRKTSYPVTCRSLSVHQDMQTIQKPFRIVQLRSINFPIKLGRSFFISHVTHNYFQNQIYHRRSKTDDLLFIFPWEYQFIWLSLFHMFYLIISGIFYNLYLLKVFKYFIQVTEKFPIPIYLYIIDISIFL